MEDIYNKPLDLIAKERIFNKLNLKRTMFNPYKIFKLDEIVPTEEDDFFRYSKLHGYVHDEGCCDVGGVSGHAGLFSNSYEVAVILQAMIQGGSIIKNFLNQKHLIFLIHVTIVSLKIEVG